MKQINDYQAAKYIVESLEINEIQVLKVQDCFVFRGYINKMTPKKIKTFVTKVLKTGKIWVARCE